MSLSSRTSASASLPSDSFLLSTTMEDKIITLTENGTPIQENDSLNGLVSDIKSKFQRSKDSRVNDEKRWLLAYKNVRGIYDTDTSFTSTEKSKIFIKVTKTKVLAAYAQIIDVLFSNNSFPIAIEPSPVPNGNIPENVHVSVNPKIPPTEPKEKKQERNPFAMASRPEIIALFENKEVAEVEDKLQEGVGTTPDEVTYEPIKMAADKMQKKIHDQLEETGATKELRMFALECAWFGTGIYKGPLGMDKEYPFWNEEGEYQPKIEFVPKSNYVSIWNSYPDPDAKNLDDCEFFIERHKMSRAELRALKKNPFFRKESITEAIARGANYQPEYWESQIRDFKYDDGSTTRYEVLEYWGSMDREMAEEAGIDVDSKSMKDVDDFQINVWICNDQIIKLVINPFKPTRIPYYAVPYEINPYSFFGIGIAENMSDTQLLMNGFMRLAVDNAALSGNVIFELDETNLVNGQSMDIYPGKVFRRQSGAPGQAIFSTKIDNVSMELMSLYDKARQLADEATSMPSYAHGGTGVTGMGRTASGMSMLMGAADKTIKAVIKNIDDFLLAPLGKAYYAFNMQFNFDKEFIGDLAIMAKGTESLIRNEVRSQKLMQFLQVGSSNNLTAPLVKGDYILRELARSLDLEEDKLINDPREAQLQALRLSAMQQKNSGPPEAQGVPAPDDPTGNGGGNISPGNAPTPDEAGFTGGGGMAGMGQPKPQQPMM